MVREPKGSKHHEAPRPGPIQPGTPLYRALEMIARAIVEKQETESPPVRRRCRKRT